jgi:hypothetical protein
MNQTSYSTNLKSPFKELEEGFSREDMGRLLTNISILLLIALEIAFQFGIKTANWNIPLIFKLMVCDHPPLSLALLLSSLSVSQPEEDNYKHKVLNLRRKCCIVLGTTARTLTTQSLSVHSQHSISIKYSTLLSGE